MKVVGLGKGVKQCQFYLWDRLECKTPACKTIIAPDSNMNRLEAYAFCDLHFEEMKAIMDRP